MAADHGLMRMSMTSTASLKPNCADGDHEWRYDGGDADTGVNGAWICVHCGAVDIDRDPPSYDDDY